MEDFRRIAVLENVVEAQLLGDMLTAESIPHAIHSFHESAYDGIFQMQRGWGAVTAATVHTGRILDLLQSLRRGSEAPVDHHPGEL